MSQRPVALITGSSRGIGRATAVWLAERGYDLVLHGLDDGEDLWTVEREVLHRGARATVGMGDVRDQSVVSALVARAIEEHGRLDALVSNAGAGLTKQFVDLTDDDWDSLVAMHLRAAVTACRAAFPALTQSRGSVVLMSSLAAGTAIGGRTGYGAVKAALEGLTRNLACEWAADGVRVNAVAPGTILTPLVEQNFERGLLNPDGVLERTPMRRFGKPTEIASVIEFLISEAASYMTGQTLHVDGGWSCWGGWR